MSNMLDVRGLSVRFPLGRRETLQAVDDVDLAVATNSVLGLVGESGSGKTTFGKAVMGLVTPTAGEIFLDGEKLPRRRSHRDYRRDAASVQMIFQDPYSSLNPRFTAEDIIAEGVRLAGGNRARQRDAAREWIDRVGLGVSLLSRYPHEFSGGQRQRLGIARALAVRPRLLICDEPVSALDVSVQAQIVNLLARLRDELGLSMLFIAHDLAMVRHISDRIAVMYMGRLMESGPAESVFERPRHPYTRLLLAASPVPDPMIERSRRNEVIPGEPAARLAGSGGCPFAHRCRYALDHCRSAVPPLELFESSHLVACWRSDEMDDEDQ